MKDKREISLTAADISRRSFLKTLGTTAAGFAVAEIYLNAIGTTRIRCFITKLNKQ